VLPANRCSKGSVKTVNQREVQTQISEGRILLMERFIDFIRSIFLVFERIIINCRAVFVFSDDLCWILKPSGLRNTLKNSDYEGKKYKDKEKDNWALPGNPLSN